MDGNTELKKTTSCRLGGKAIYRKIFIRLLECKLCKEAFGSKEDLIVHMMFAHNEML